MLRHRLECLFSTPLLPGTTTGCWTRGGLTPRAGSGSWQGLTLLHYPPQPEPLFWSLMPQAVSTSQLSLRRFCQRNLSTWPTTSAHVKPKSGREYPTKSAHVEPKSGRAYAPGSWCRPTTTGRELCRSSTTARHPRRRRCIGLARRTCRRLRSTTQCCRGTPC